MKILTCEINLPRLIVHFCCEPARHHDRLAAAARGARVPWVSEGVANELRHAPRRSPDGAPAHRRRRREGGSGHHSSGSERTLTLHTSRATGSNPFHQADISLCNGTTKNSSKAIASHGVKHSCNSRAVGNVRTHAHTHKHTYSSGESSLNL